MQLVYPAAVPQRTLLDRADQSKIEHDERLFDDNSDQNVRPSLLKSALPYSLLLLPDNRAVALHLLYDLTGNTADILTILRDCIGTLRLNRKQLRFEL